MRREITGFLGFFCIAVGIALYSVRLSVIFAGTILSLIAIVYPGDGKPSGKV
jgi:hypothetical protein